jgi:(p)ppGpp synthase/HD superfamily hydrolase
MARRMTLADKNAMLARGEPFIVHPAEVAKLTAVYETDPKILLACIVESGTLDTSAVLRTVQRMLNALPVTDKENAAFEAFRRVWSDPTDKERAGVIALAQRIAGKNARPLHWAKPPETWEDWPNVVLIQYPRE